MISKDIYKMINTCLDYADIISRKPESNFPKNSRMSLRNLLKDDMLTFFGYLYDPSSEDLTAQLQFINANLGIIITEQNFKRFVADRCRSDRFLANVPQSLMYFVSDDTSPLSQRTGYGISLSKYLVNCFNDAGVQFIAYGGISNKEADRLAQYINMMNDYVQRFNVYGSDTLDNNRDKVIFGGKVSNNNRGGDRLPEPDRIGFGGGINRNEGRPGSSSDSFEEPSSVRGRAMDVAPGGAMKNEKSLEELQEELNALVGLDKVKTSLASLVNLIKVKTMRDKLGLKTPDISLHLVFSGNPGTGKTTVARLLARIYHQLGVVSTGQFIEVDRAGLVEGYVGQTAIKTSEVIDSAMGGVLFIDEAYTLAGGKEGEDFGQEAIDTLLKRMEDNREDLVVIVAGYTKEMEKFINSNPGLKSRFNKFIEFPDYSGEEMYRIFHDMCTANDYILDKDAEEHVKKYLADISVNHGDNFANGREVRNYFERSVERQASRVVSEPQIDADSLTTFKLADVLE